MEDRRWKTEPGGGSRLRGVRARERVRRNCLGETSKSGAPLVILYASKLEEAQAHVEKAGGKIVKPIFSFPGGRRFHFTE